MKSMLKIEFYRLFHRKELYVSLLAGCALSVWLGVLSVQLLQQRVEQLATAPPESGAYFFLPSVFNKAIGIDHAALPTTILFALLPLLVIFPYATSYAEDRASGYLKNILTRTARRNYLAAKYAATLFSAFLTCCGIFFFSVFLTSMLLPGLLPQSAAFTFPAAANSGMWSGLYRKTPYLYLLLYTLLDGVYYAAYATLALAVSVAVPRRFVALIVPAVAFFCSTSVFNRLNAWAWMPELFLRQCQLVDVSAGIFAIEIAVLLAVSGLCFFIAGEKKHVL